MFLSGGFISLFACSNALKAAASSGCISQDIKTFDAPILWPEDQIAFYAYNRSPSSGSVLAILLKIKQTKERYLARAVLTNRQQEVIEVFYFDETNQSKEGFPPYLIVQGLPPDGTYDLIMQVIEKDQPVIFRFVFDPLKLKHNPLFYNDLLPEKVREDLKASHKSGITTAYELAPDYYKQAFCRDDLYAACLLDHFPKISLSFSKETVDDFAFHIDYNHQDISQKHYARYFIVTDPVGRVLALKKRSFTDQETYKTLTLHPMTLKERKDQWGFISLEEPSLSDCPYVMIFMDDVLEAFTQTNFSLI